MMHSVRFLLLLSVIVAVLFDDSINGVEGRLLAPQRPQQQQQQQEHREAIELPDLPFVSKQASPTKYDSSNPRNRPWVNEFHYDNIGTDVNEFIEVAAPSTLSVEGFKIVLYDGFYSKMYPSDANYSLADFQVGETRNGITFYSRRFKPMNCTTGSPWCGFQNGRDGFALAYFETPTKGEVLEFWSYEGIFTARDGPATNMTSASVGVWERPTTPIGWSISKAGIGCVPTDFTFLLTTQWTPGLENANQTITCTTMFLNEFSYDNQDDGVGQFIEVATNIDDDDDELARYSIVLYNGQDGLPYGTLPLASFTKGDVEEDTGIAFYYYEFPTAVVVSRQGLLVTEPTGNGTDMPPVAGIVLAQTTIVVDENKEKVEKDVVLEFWSYGGTFTAMGGVAEGQTSVDVGVQQSSTTPVGSSLQLAGVGCASKNFEWTAVESSQVDVENEIGETRGAINVGQQLKCLVTPTPMVDPATESQGDEKDEPDGTDDFVNQDDDFLGEDPIIIEGGEHSEASTSTINAILEKKSGQHFAFEEGADKVMHPVQDEDGDE